MATWHTVESARDEWADAPYDADDGDTILASLLSAAKDAVLAFAPAVETPLVTIPDGYRLAQLREAQNQWNGTKTPSADGYIDGGQYNMGPVYMPWYKLVRPKSGRPVMG